MGLPPFAVVDVETSGLRPRRDNLLQIAVVTVEADGTLVDSWSTLVRLRRPWSRVGPRHIHGLQRRRLLRATPAAEALIGLAERLEGALFTAHNAEFDAAFIRRWSATHGRPLVVDRPLCTLELSRRLDPDRIERHGLADVSARYGVELIDHHDALADATAAARVLPHLLAANGVSDAADLDDLRSVDGEVLSKRTRSGAV